MEAPAPAAGAVEARTDAHAEAHPESEPHVQDAAESSSVPKIFRALRHPNYRLLWMGNLISQSGDWMDQVAFSWLVYDMTGSTVMLALINVCRAGPIIVFTLIGGAVADRVERRKLLFLTQSCQMMLAILLALLLTLDLLQVWMAFAIAVLRGVTASFNQPARQSLISELVPTKDLSNAIALNSATMNFTKVIGPAAGGVLIAAVGVAGAFYLNAASFIAVLLSLYFMELPARPDKPHKGGILNDLREGFVYIRKEAALMTLIFLALMPMVLAQPYQTMLTVFAKDVFKVGSTGLGLMQSAAAVGSVVGAVSMAASSGDAPDVHKMLLGLVGLGAMILLFAFVPTLWVAMPALAVTGFCFQTYQTSNNTLLQLKVDPEFRARVLSMLFLQRGLVPLGTMSVGFLTTWVGPRWAVGSMAMAMLTLSIGIYPFALPILTRLVPKERLLGDDTDDAHDGDSGQQRTDSAGGMELQNLAVATHEALAVSERPPAPLAPPAEPATGGEAQAEPAPSSAPVAVSDASHESAADKLISQLPHTK